MDRKERCIISDSDIPAGSGGINGEGGVLLRTIATSANYYRDITTHHPPYCPPNGRRM